jgi:hypothetical protein
MIVNFGQKLYLARPTSIIDGSVQYQDLLSVRRCKRLQESHCDHLGQKPDQTTPIIPVTTEESVNSVFSHLRLRIPVNPGEDVFTNKGQFKNGTKNQKWPDTTELPDAGLV